MSSHCSSQASPGRSNWCASPYPSPPAIWSCIHSLPVAVAAFANGDGVKGVGAQFESYNGRVLQGSVAGTAVGHPERAKTQQPRGLDGRDDNIMIISSHCLLPNDGVGVSCLIYFLLGLWHKKC